MEKKLVIVTELCKSYGTGEQKLQVLNGVQMNVNQGDFISIMGPSGSGKSTLLYIIGGLEKCDSGKVILDGNDISDLNDKKMSEFRRQNIGFVFQSYNLLKNLTVEENISMPLLLDNSMNKKSKESVIHMLEVLGLQDKRKMIISKLSGGQMQRVAIGRALINQPKIILADEPTGSLDRKTSTEIVELLKQINEDFKTTIIIVTHAHEIAEYSSRCYNIIDGRLYTD